MKLMGHIVACFPDMATSLGAARGIIKGGAEYLEVQFPFSDPNADGVVIQSACDRALQSGFRVKDGFAMVESLKDSAKIIIVTYANIVFKYGAESFVKKAVKSGAWGILVPDLLYDSDMPLKRYARDCGVKIIHLITPSTPQSRMKHIIKHSDGIVYVVARRGITGRTTDVDSALFKYLASVRKLCDKQIALGFGINNPAQIARLRDFADIIVVGSYFVEKIANLGGKNAQNALREATIALGVR